MTKVERGLHGSVPPSPRERTVPHSPSTRPSSRPRASLPVAEHPKPIRVTERRLQQGRTRFTDSSVVFNAHSAEDDHRLERAHLSHHISQRHGSAALPSKKDSGPRIESVTLDPRVETLRNPDYFAESKRLHSPLPARVHSGQVSPWTTGDFGGEAGGGSGLTTGRDRPYQGTHALHYTSSRVHPHAPMGFDAIRCDVQLAASRTLREFTLGPAAGVPLHHRHDPRDPSVNLSRLEAHAQMQASHSLVLPVTSPVRGAVVLTSLRHQPSAPPNAVRSRAKGELVYGGPSHLLKERARELKHLEQHAAKSYVAGSEPPPYQSSSGGAALGSEGKPAQGPGVASLHFESKKGQPKTLNLNHIQGAYNHIAKPPINQPKSLKQKMNQKQTRKHHPIPLK